MSMDVQVPPPRYMPRKVWLAHILVGVLALNDLHTDFHSDCISEFGFSIPPPPLPVSLLFVLFIAVLTRVRWSLTRMRWSNFGLDLPDGEDAKHF